MENYENDLIKRLDPSGKYTLEYVRMRIQEKQMQNRKADRNENDNLENIDLNIEYASNARFNNIKRFSDKWIEEQAKNNSRK